MPHFQLTIRSPEKDIFDGKVKSITFDSEVGRMQILPHHASITGTIFFTKIIVDTDEKDEEFIGRRGIFLFDNDKNEAIMLLLSCELKSEISHQSAREYLDFIKEKLKNKESLSEYQIKYLEGEKFAVEKQVKITN